MQGEFGARQADIERQWREVRSRRNIYMCERRARVESYGKETPVSYLSVDPPPQPGTEVMKASGVKEQLDELRKCDDV